MWSAENVANRIKLLAFCFTYSSVPFLGHIENVTTAFFKHYGSHVHARKNMLILADNGAQGNSILTTSKVQA